MPKLSVYVADDLWQRAKNARPEASTSQLVQEALLNLADSSEIRPSFARERPKSFEPAIRLQAQRLESEAKRLYESGYKFGVETAKKLDWGSLDDLAAYGWKLGPWLESLARRGSEVVEDFNLLGAEFSVEGGEITFDAGVLDALKDVWHTVRRAD